MLKSKCREVESCFFVRNFVTPVRFDVIFFDFYAFKIFSAEPINQSAPLIHQRGRKQPLGHLFVMSCIASLMFWYSSLRTLSEPQKHTEGPPQLLVCAALCVKKYATSTWKC